MEPFIVRTISRLKSLVSGNRVASSDNYIFDFKKDISRVKNIYTDNELSVFKLKETSKQSHVGVEQFLRESSQNTAKTTQKNRNLIALIPELLPAQTIWESSILSPVDNQTNSLSFSLDSAEFIDEKVRKEIENFYDHLFNRQFNTEEMILKVVRECLFGAGSFPVLILPQQNVNILKAAVDMTTVSQENLNALSFKYDITLNDKSIPTLTKIKNIALAENHNLSFGLESFSLDSIVNMEVHELDLLTSINEDLTGFEISMESLKTNKVVNTVTSWVKDVKDHIVVSNNPQIINSPVNNSKKVLTGIMNQLDVEEDDAISMFKDMFQHSVGSSYQSSMNRTTISLNDKIIDSSRFPVIVEVPPECVIPVGIGNETIGFYILTDHWVTPMSKSMLSNYDRHFSNNLIDMSADAVYGHEGVNGTKNQLNNMQKYMAATTVFEVTLKKLLEDKLSRMGLVGMSVARHQSISRCLFHHLLQQKDVGLIFVPKHLMVYFATDYRTDGTGKSLLENIEHVLAMRSTLLVSRLLAETRAAVEKTKITVDVSDDVNYLQTLRMLQNAFYNKNSLKFSNDPDSIVRNIHESRISLVPKNLKGAPDFSIETEPGSTQTVKPSDELMEYCDRGVMTGLLTPRSAIQETENTDYATSLDSRNLHFNNVSRQKRDIILLHLKQYIMTISVYSGYIKENIERIVSGFYMVTKDSDTYKMDNQILTSDTANSSVDSSDKAKSDKTDEPANGSDSENENKENEVSSRRTQVIQGPQTTHPYATFTLQNDDEEETLDEEKSSDEYNESSADYVESKITVQPEKEVIGSSKQTLSDKQLKEICAQIIFHIQPKLPSPNVIKNKSEFEEVTSYIEMLDKILEVVYPTELVPIDDSELKNYYNALKLKIKRDNLLSFMSRVGKQELFANIDNEEISFEWHSELMQLLTNGMQFIKDQKKVLTPTVEGESSDSGGFGL